MIINGISKKSNRIPIFINIVTWLFPLLSFYFFGASFINLSFWKGVYFTSILALLVIFYDVTFKKKVSTVTSNIRNLTLYFLISIFFSYLLWGQSIILGFRSTAPLLAILFYFFLVRFKISRKMIEKVVYIYAIIWILIWLFTLLSSLRLFGVFASERGLSRFFIPGDGFVYLAFFMFVNKWIIEKKHIWIIIALCLYIVILLQVTRQTIVCSTLIVVYYFFKKKKHVFLYLIPLFLILQFFSIKIENHSPLGSLIQLSEQQYKDNTHGNTYARILEYDFFLFHFNSEPIPILLGNGVPHDESLYGKRILFLKSMRHVFLSDVGYAAIFVEIGLVGLFFFLRCFYSLKKQKYTTHIFDGAKMYLLYILIVDIMSYVYSNHVVTVAIAFYMIELANRNNKRFELKITNG